MSWWPHPGELLSAARYLQDEEPAEAPKLEAGDAATLGALGQTSLEAVLALCPELSDPQISAADGGWKTAVTSKDGTVKVLERFDWFESEPASQFPTVKTVGHLDLSALLSDAGDVDAAHKAIQSVFGNLCADEHAVRKEWDRDLQEMDVLETAEFVPAHGKPGAAAGSLSVVYRNYSAPVRAVTGRDFVAINGKCRYGDAYISFGQSVQFSKAPTDTGLVRGNAAVSGIIVRLVDGSKCEITRLLHLEPRGKIPGWVVNITKKKNVQSFEHILKMVPGWIQRGAGNLDFVASLPEVAKGSAGAAGVQAAPRPSPNEGKTEQTEAASGGDISPVAAASIASASQPPLTVSDLHAGGSAPPAADGRYVDYNDLSESDFSSDSEAEWADASAIPEYNATLVHSALQATQANSQLSHNVASLASSVGHLQDQLRETNERLKDLQESQNEQLRRSRLLTKGMDDGDAGEAGWGTAALVGAVLWPLVVFALESA